MKITQIILFICALWCSVKFLIRLMQMHAEESAGVHSGITLASMMGYQISAIASWSALYAIRILFVLLLFVQTVSAQDLLGDTTVVPVEFIDMKAIRNGEEIRFVWRTASEVNNDYFTIERSTDAVTWEEVAEVPGSGTSKLISVYEYRITDMQKAYYRLSQTDYDRSMAYLTVVMVPAYAMSEDRWYDLQGRPVERDSPGLKIRVNGNSASKVYH